MAVTVVTGPPCGGKSTYIRERASGDDIVVDSDRLALALCSEDTPHHEYPDDIRELTRGLRYAAIRAALKVHKGRTVWIIDTAPSPGARDMYRSARAEFVLCDPGLDVVLDRIKDQRPERIRQVALDYYRTAR